MKKYIKYIITTLTVAILTTGCASYPVMWKKSSMNNVEKGAVRGGLAGGIIGGVVGHNTAKYTHGTVSRQAVRGIVGGVVGGAVVGAILGYALDQKARAEKAEAGVEKVVDN